MARNDDLLMKALSRFFANKEHTVELMQVLRGKNPPVSLRLLDYFVTNYARRRKTTICGEHHPVVCVHSSYRSQLKAFSKQQFDPFRRRERISFAVDDNKHIIETTVGQLNFFRWAIESGVLRYVMENKHVIEQDMCHPDEEQLPEQDAKNNETCISGRENANNQLHVATFDAPQIVAFD
jgi:hypothetical protein